MPQACLKRVCLFPAVLVVSAVMLGCGDIGVYYRSPGPPPPPPVAGPVGVAPAPGYVWIDGFFDLRPHGWIWVPGYWARPPYPRAQWVRPHWENRGGRYRFHRGHWHR